MKEYIILTILNNTLVFNYRTINNEEKVFVNKNSFFKECLFYDLKYFKNNYKKIINNIKKNNINQINTIKILRLVTFKYVSDIINSFSIENVVFDFMSTLDIEDYNLFLNNNSIRNIYCYYMPNGIKDKFLKKNIKIHTSSIKKITNEFFDQQDAFDHDTLYYKNVIKIKDSYPQLIDDLKEFLKINYNLKAIHIYTYSRDLIESIVDLVKNDESRNVIVFLHQGYDKGNFIINNFEWLKELSDKCKEDYTCEFRIIYSNSFLKNNLFKQLTFNNLKLIAVLCIYVSIVSLIIVKAYEYIEQISVEQLRNQIVAEARNAVDDESFEYDEELPDVEDNIFDEEQDSQPQTGQQTTTKKEKPKPKPKYSIAFSSLNALKKINNDVRGYLTVNNTQISYPVVQGSDNNYYLNHDIYKKKTYVGWIYLDYRNNLKAFNDNNIIYGHNMPNGTMFGSLKKVLNSSWRKKKENMVISLETESGSYKFQIFSAYKVDYTTDYLKVHFDSKDEKEDFIKLISGRSSFKTDTQVSADDTILTLSTCAGGNNKRFAVHAVLIKEGKKEE